MMRTVEYRFFDHGTRREVEVLNVEQTASATVVVCGDAPDARIPELREGYILVLNSDEVAELDVRAGQRRTLEFRHDARAPLKGYWAVLPGGAP